MRISRVETFAIQAQPTDRQVYWGSRAWGNEEKGPGELSCEYPPRQRRRFVYSKTIDTVLVKVTTADGVVGWGEAKAPVAPQATKQIIDLLLADIVIGEDPRDTTVLWERMYAGMRVRGHRAGFYLEAIAGVDIALWDLAGKASGVPIYQLLGGAFRNPVRVYASGLPALAISAPPDAFEQLTAEARQIRAQGHTALKMALGRGLAGDIKSVRTIREALGDDFIIYADAAGAYDRAQALRLGRELEELGVGFFELPIFPEDLDGYVELAKALTIPIAIDTLTSRYEARDFVSRGGVDIVQPDVCRAGGITECRRIAELADAFGVGFAPHVSIGSAVHFAATGHLATAMPNTITSEYWIGVNPLGDTIIEEPLVLADGYMYTPTGAGLGIRIREAALPR
ncbi:MAG TPA: mandelate racemase/muconate lactonizing enzyme family protein [Vicinamibacterales bacterium]|jgi:D-arabinonate dehydratase/D-galactarolactone cycloisomerase|nr:mandelate racemase/muconate lactonizing enzyme family protein [Vicinamibacterales bacterium]